MNPRKISRRKMYKTIWFIFDLPIFPIFRTYSRLRKYEFVGKRGQIQYESYSLIHHSTEEFERRFYPNSFEITRPIHYFTQAKNVIWIMIHQFWLKLPQKSLVSHWHLIQRPDDHLAWLLNLWGLILKI